MSKYFIIIDKTDGDNEERVTSDYDHAERIAAKFRKKKDVIHVEVVKED